MAYDEHLAERIRKGLRDAKALFEEKKMMGGLCFMVNDKMAVGVMKNQLMARIDPDVREKALQMTGVHPMEFTGKTLQGFVLVDSSALDMDADLAYWIGLTLEFNPRAKSSKKKN